MTQANPNFAKEMLARALRASDDDDPETRSRSLAKAEKWIDVFTGMLNGQLHVGSRTPTSAPAWATLEVLTGGFATGSLLAGGSLLAHEQELRERIRASSEDTGRAQLNAYYLTDAGQRELADLLESGRYAVDLPEEAALLVVCGLLSSSRAERARELLDEIGPYFGQLRFYPRPATAQVSDGSQVHVRTIGEVCAALLAKAPHTRVATLKRVVQDWLPLYDKLVDLMLDSVEGAPPTVELSSEGIPVRDNVGRYALSGGWPLQVFPEGWSTRALELVATYERLRAGSEKLRRGRSDAPLHVLSEVARQAATSPEKLTGRDVGRVRMILARTVAKRGAPGSNQRSELRRQQSESVAAPLHSVVAAATAEVLSGLPQEEGLNEVDSAIAEGARRVSIEPSEFPETLVHRLRMCLKAPIAELIEQGIISSGDVLASVLPQVTGESVAQGMADPAARRLYERLYRAFRRRRSLLLLNYESQVRLSELPWAKALEAERQTGAETREAASTVLRRVALIALTSFPHAILPNKLLQELRAVASAAGTPVPLVDELAADIFMGDFGPKFVEAAKIAGELLDGSVYARYYGIDYSQVGTLGAKPPGRLKRALGLSNETTLARICEQLAGVDASGWSVARNGAIIEQQQIVTTQNLASVYTLLSPENRSELAPAQLARACFGWVCNRQQLKMPNFHSRLATAKQTAYAWRQMLFFLAVTPSEQQREFLVHARDGMAQQSQEFRSRFVPALRGLTAALEGSPLRREDRFLGWSTETKWALGPEGEVSRQRRSGT